jgi:hypothetical protein
MNQAEYVEIVGPAPMLEAAQEYERWLDCHPEVRIRMSDDDIRIDTRRHTLPILTANDVSKWS